ncbi:cytidine deaminase [Dysgonomonas sp. PH5-45]|uniref:cytidine deaminase n=1 Tax=unclassified Dysgonomonas TaxID=2630389 RepID=UPI002472EBFE|nr:MULTISPECIES: cytidine deaminase [unclassified Dysgonomonas]MDH6355791.1 cytidine deaminase [Dysgonomonas sp. PH5-45]MDH6388689.1 cytidine deaminase [Dysgonomonas sp. PH5-37]
MKNIVLNTKIQVYNIDEASQTQKKLIEAAKEATQRAYAPYSGYRVGAAVLLDNGQVITGNNQENAAYPSGLCAERTALFYANAQHPDVAVKMMAVIAYNNGDFTDDVCSPCGSCRQVLTEIENRFDTPVTILMCSKDQVYKVESACELLPLCFTKKSLM